MRASAWPRAVIRAPFLVVSNQETEEAERQRRLWRQLTPVQRALLGTDGSLTLLLKALVGEDVTVTTFPQTLLNVTEPHPELELEVGIRLLRRTALLLTSTSQRLFAYAESQIAFDRLGAPLQERLLGGQEPIGILLRAARLETFRELLDWGRSPPPPLARQYFGDYPMVYRTYKIIVGSEPIMVIREYFAAHLIQADMECESP